MSIPLTPGVVPIDPLATEALAASLDLLAQRLASLAATEDDAARSAGEDWRGFTRQWFDREHLQLFGQLRYAAAAAAEGAVAARRQAVRPIP
ncbi:MAG: hypothetical protein ACR2MB_08700 [Acidimicrobiales bacterium]